MPQESMHHPQQSQAGFSSQDFARFQQMQPNARTASPVTQQMPGMSSFNSYQRPIGMGGFGMGGMGMSGMNMMHQHAPPHLEQQTQDKGKGKMVELDDEHWEEQFKAIDLEALEKEQNASVEAELNQLDRSVDSLHVGSETNEFGDFEAIWKIGRASCRERVF